MKRKECYSREVDTIQCLGYSGDPNGALLGFWADFEAFRPQHLEVRVGRICAFLRESYRGPQLS